jgi:hypothetical protein
MADVTTLTQTGMDKATGIKFEVKGKYYVMCFFLLFLQCIVNDYSILVPAKAHTLIYISLYLAPIRFSWSPSMGSSQPNS